MKEEGARSSGFCGVAACNATPDPPHQACERRSIGGEGKPTRGRRVGVAAEVRPTTRAPRPSTRRSCPASRARARARATGRRGRDRCR
eukprot:1310215-Prymnesium_polylepis.1